MGSALKTETLVVLGVALAVVYLAKKAGEAATDAAKAVIPYVNPADERNMVNTAATTLWQWASGSTGTIGGDLYDYVHKGEPIFGATPDPVTGLTPAYNYTPAQQAADLDAIRRLEAGYHGM